MHTHKCLCADEPWNCATDITPPGIRCRDVYPMLCHECVSRMIEQASQRDLEFMTILGESDPLLAHAATARLIKGAEIR